MSEKISPYGRKLERLEGALTLAPAKVNLFLHITGRKADGYHLLQSLMMRIDWYDRLAFEVRDDGRVVRHDVRFECDSSHDACISASFVAATTQHYALGADDLCVRAARALQLTTGCKLGVDIYLEKNIPAEAGLGGGSSDAASTLLALNRLWGLHLDLQLLMKIGLGLGADVPFFLLERHALVGGVGEELEPVDLNSCHLVVVKPAQGVSTAAVFMHPQLTRNSKLLEKEAIMSVFAASAVESGFNLRNDMQNAAIDLCPEIGFAINALQSQGLDAKMTGSGSAVFAYCDADFDVGLLSLPHSFRAKVCSVI